MGAELELDMFDVTNKTTCFDGKFEIHPPFFKRIFGVEIQKVEFNPENSNFFGIFTLNNF